MKRNLGPICIEIWTKVKIGPSDTDNKDFLIDYKYFIYYKNVVSLTLFDIFIKLYFSLMIN